MATILLFSSTNTVQGEVRLANLFSDGMVIQRNEPIKIWGWADANEKVELKFNKASASSVADESGYWSVTLPAMKEGGPYTIKVNNKTVSDILIGDVWLCSGQSNMELTVSRVMDMFADEITSYDNDQIRYVKVPITYNYHAPQSDLPNCTWKSINKEDVMNYSALCYFFAKELYKTAKVPIGIVNSSLGGSPIEAWIGDEMYEDYPVIKNSLGMYRSDDYMSTSRKASGLLNNAWYGTLNAVDPGLLGNWKSINVDVSEWEKADLFSNKWQRDADGQPAIGTIWFNRTFSAEGLDISKDATLRLGCIVDADSVFVNGIFVGTTSYQYPPRIYNVPAGTLKTSNNIITIRVITNGNAHFVEDKPYKIVQDNSEISLLGEWNYKRGAVMPSMPGSGLPQQMGPTGLYNAMIAPIYGAKFSGAIWYQGESNTGRTWQYADLLTNMINLWRGGFEQPNMPFFVIQLPEFLRPRANPSESGWAQMREAQSEAIKRTENSAVITTLGTGEWNDIHPLDKKTIGNRIALAARALVYGEKIVYSAPTLQSATHQENKVYLTFDMQGGKFDTSETIKGFALAGDDGRFVWADAKIDGNKVIVWSNQVDSPKQVRYAWADNPEGANLCNTIGLPVGSFRSDVK